MTKEKKWKLKSDGLTKIQREKLRMELLGLSLDCSTGHGTKEKFRRKTELFYLLTDVWIRD